MTVIKGLIRAGGEGNVNTPCEESKWLMEDKAREFDSVWRIYRCEQIKVDGRWANTFQTDENRRKTEEKAKATSFYYTFKFGSCFHRYVECRISLPMPEMLKNPHLDQLRVWVNINILLYRVGWKNPSTTMDTRNLSMCADHCFRTESSMEHDFVLSFHI